MTHDFDPQRDLGLERVIDVPRERVWAAWTTPALLMRWFTPAPWRTVECDIDLRPGGIFRTVMRSPEGQDFPNVGCFLEIVPHEKLAFTTALGPGFRPAPAAESVPTCTVIIRLEPAGAGTRYTAHVLHENAAACKRHDEMGFHDGWGAALAQLVTVAKS